MKIKAPDGWTNFSMHGIEHVLEADGTIELPDYDGQFLIENHGFTKIARAAFTEVSQEQNTAGSFSE